MAGDDASREFFIQPICFLASRAESRFVTQP